MILFPDDCIVLTLLVLLLVIFGEKWYKKLDRKYKEFMWRLEEKNDLREENARRVYQFIGQFSKKDRKEVLALRPDLKKHWRYARLRWGEPPETETPEKYKLSE